METSLDKGIQGKEAKKVLPTLHKTPPNGTIGGVFVCGGKSLNPGPPGYAAPIVIRRYLQAWQTKPRPTPRRKRRAALPLPRRSRRNKRWSPAWTAASAPSICVPLYGYREGAGVRPPIILPSPWRAEPGDDFLRVPGDADEPPSHMGQAFADPKTGIGADLMDMYEK